MSLCISLCTSREASSEVTNLSTPGSLLAEICIFAASINFLLTPVFFFLQLLRHVPVFFEHVGGIRHRSNVFRTKSCFNHFLDRCTAHVTQSFFYDLHEQRTCTQVLVAAIRMAFYRLCCQSALQCAYICLCTVDVLHRPCRQKLAFTQLRATSAFLHCLWQ